VSQVFVSLDLFILKIGLLGEEFELSTNNFMFVYVKKVKVKVSLCLINEALLHEDVWGRGCIDPCFLDLGTSWRRMDSFTPRLLYPWERAPGTHWIEGWADPRDGLDDMEK
jgi:hypothetical protein